jgi:hypothetical protein
MEKIALEFERRRRYLILKSTEIEPQAKGAVWTARQVSTIGRERALQQLFLPAARELERRA